MYANKEKDASHLTKSNTQIKIYCYYVFISYKYNLKRKLFLSSLQDSKEHNHWDQ